MKNKIFKFLSPLVIMSMVFSVFVPLVKIEAEASNKINICHATGAHANPYNLISISKDSIAGGHDIHDGGVYPANPWGDIIPPYEIDGGGNYLGKNWDNDGQAIWNNGCVVPSSNGNGQGSETATIVAHKIVCDNESDLPNWGAGGADITSTTASDYIAGKSENCRLVDWAFEWSLDGVPNPGDNVETGGSSWNIFSNNSNATIPVGGRIWVREQTDLRYIPFSGTVGNPHDDYSAEFYCHTDVLNYDNWDWINLVVAGQTYYCVGFNVPKMCSVVSDTTNIIEDGTNAIETWNHSAWYDETLLGGMAKWIWETFNVLNPTMEETKIFIKEFNLDEEPISAEIEVAADNTFILEINGVEIANEQGGNNYTSTKKYQVSNLIAGKNKIKITVKNLPGSSDPEKNPAGVLYNLAIVGGIDCADVVPVDMCLNLEGHQSSVPEGYVEDDGNCSIKNEEPEPTTGNLTIIKNIQGQTELLPENVNISVRTLEDSVIETKTGSSTGQIYSLLQAGFYLITEDGQWEDSWSVSYSGDCSAHSENPRIGQVNILAGQDYVCTMTNIYSPLEEKGEITVRKEFHNLPRQMSLPLEDYCFVVNGEDPHYCFNQGSSSRTVEVPYGPYTITEYEIGEEWEVSYQGDCEGTIDVESAELTCTIVNTLKSQSDPVLGCMDPFANNYNPKANKDNNPSLCLYTTTSSGGSRYFGPQVLGASTGEVLGATASCGIYTDKYLRKGYRGNNVTAVVKLQIFLNNHMNANLLTDGVFGAKTEAALKAFQLKHKDKILSPWGISYPTGIFYLTTQTEVNNIMCPELNLPIPTSLMPFGKHPLTPKK